MIKSSNFYAPPKYVQMPPFRFATEGRGPDVTSNPEHDDSVAHIFTIFCGKIKEVVPKLASLMHCNGDVATQQTYRSYYASCHIHFI